MANDAKNVTVGKPAVTGAVFVAPEGTSLPTDATSTLNAAFKNLGYVSDNGMTNTNSPSSGNIKAWGGDVVETYQDEKKDEFKFKLIESLNPDVLKLVYGESNVTGTSLSSGLTVKANALAAGKHSFVVETVVGETTLKRIVIPSAAMTAVGDIVYKDNEAVGYDLTITATPDSSGNTHYEYFKTPAASQGSGGGSST